MRWCYKLKDTTYSVRVDFSKETVEICKKLWDQVKSCKKTESMLLTNTIRQLRGIFNLDGSMFFGAMVLFFRLIIILFKMNTPKNDFGKLRFSLLD